MGKKPKLRTLPWDKDKIIEVRIEEITASKCSVTKTPMQLDINVNYIPGDRIIEFVSFRKYVNYMASRRSFTVEEFTHELHQRLWEVLEPRALIVRVKCRTAEHGEVEVVKSVYTRDYLVSVYTAKSLVELKALDKALETDLDTTLKVFRRMGFAPRTYGSRLTSEGESK